MEPNQAISGGPGSAALSWGQGDTPAGLTAIRRVLAGVMNMWLRAQAVRALAPGNWR
jgi:hypothetical protein